MRRSAARCCSATEKLWETSSDKKASSRVFAAVSHSRTARGRRPKTSRDSKRESRRSFASSTQERSSLSFFRVLGVFTGWSVVEDASANSVCSLLERFSSFSARLFRACRSLSGRPRYASRARSMSAAAWVRRLWAAAIAVPRVSTSSFTTESLCEGSRFEGAFDVSSCFCVLCVRCFLLTQR